MSEKGKGFGQSLLRYVIAIAVFILLGAVIAFVSSYVSSHGKQFSKADYKDLNPLIESGEELPVGEWGRISIRWVLDVFAEEENSYKTYGISFKAGKSEYYLAVLDDLRAIAIQAADETEIARLNQMSEEFWAVEDYETLPARDFEGKIEKMTNKQLLGYYDEILTQAGFKDADSLVNIQYLILNTAAIPTRNVLMYVGIGALAVIAVIVILRMRKKSRQEDAPTLEQTNDQAKVSITRGNMGFHP